MNPQNPQQNAAGGPLPPPQQPQQPLQPYYPPQPPAAQQPPVQAFPANQPVVTQAPHEQYEFIMNPGQLQKSPGVLGVVKGGSIFKMVSIIGGGLVLVILIVAVLSSLLGGASNLAPMVTVAEDQTELIRIATLGTSKATGQSTQNVSYNAKLSLTSSQQQLLAYMSGNGTKVGAKQLRLKQNAQTTTTLDNAITTSTFDTAFSDVMKTELTDYSKDLAAAYKANPGPRGKALLSKTYDQAQLLLSQTTQAASD